MSLTSCNNCKLKNNCPHDFTDCWKGGDYIFWVSPCKPRVIIKDRIYVMKCDKYIKIGVSKNPQARIKELQIGNPLDIKLLFSIEYDDAYRIEKEFHEHFKEYRIRGEWFKYSNAVEIWVNGLTKMGGSLEMVPA